MNEELIVSDAFLSHLEKELQGQEFVEIDPDPRNPNSKNEQRHIWLYTDPTVTWRNKLGTFEMPGWYRVEGRFIDLYVVLTLPSDSLEAIRGPYRFDMADPNPKGLVATIQGMFRRVRAYVKKEAEKKNAKR